MNSTQTETARPRERTATALPEATKARLQDLADQFTREWREIHEGIMKCGQILIQAKDAEGHGGFMKLFKGHPQAVARPISIKLPTAEKLMRVARNPILSNSTNWSNLPIALYTLDLLNQFEQPDLERLIGEGKVSADTTHEQVHMLLYYRTATTPAEQAVITRRLKAYQKRLKRRSTEGCLCECRCGDVHPDKRLISGPKLPDLSQKQEGKGEA